MAWMEIRYEKGVSGGDVMMSTITSLQWAVGLVAAAAMKAEVAERCAQLTIAPVHVRV